MFFLLVIFAYLLILTKIYQADLRRRRFFSQICQELARHYWLCKYFCKSIRWCFNRIQKSTDSFSVYLPPWFVYNLSVILISLIVKISHCTQCIPATSQYQMLFGTNHKQSGTSLPCFTSRVSLPFFTEELSERIIKYEKPLGSFTRQYFQLYGSSSLMRMALVKSWLIKKGWLPSLCGRFCVLASFAIRIRNYHAIYCYNSRAIGQL